MSHIEISRFTPVEEKTITQLVQKLRLTFSQNKLSKTYIYEISRREKISVAEILAGTVQTDRKAFMQSLFEQRFPETSQLMRNGEWQPCK